MRIQPTSFIFKLIQVPGIYILKSFDLIVSLFTNDQPYIYHQDHPILKYLHLNSDKILNEYSEKEIIHNFRNIKDFYKVQSDINSDDNWKGTPLFIFNYSFKENIKQFPFTYSVVSNIPGCTSAMFSILGPGKHIPPHKGIYKGIFRCLFILNVPQGDNCWIRINQRKIIFKKGEGIIFDETSEHEVLNETSGNRVALYLDIYRKFPFPINVLNKVVYFLLRRSPFIRNVVEEYVFISPTLIGYQDSLPPKFN